VVETGINMARFGSSAHVAAWVGVAPGNDASAGKQRYRHTRHGNQPLRTVLTQLAHTAARTKRTYLSALSHGMVTRRGRKEALVAVARAKVASIFHMLMRQEPSRDLGANCFDEQCRHHLVGR
jgi:transposase